MKTTKVALFEDYGCMSDDELDILVCNLTASQLFGFISMCMVYNAEQNVKRWTPMVCAVKKNPVDKRQEV